MTVSTRAARTNVTVERVDRLDDSTASIGDGDGFVIGGGAILACWPLRGSAPRVGSSPVSPLPLMEKHPPRRAAVLRSSGTEVPSFALPVTTETDPDRHGRTMMVVGGARQHGASRRLSVTALLAL